jgi:hypothetical protein
MYCIRPADINQYFKLQMHILKYSSWQVSYSYMFRQRDAILTDSDKKQYTIQHTKLFTVSPKMERLIY